MKQVQVHKPTGSTLFIDNYTLIQTDRHHQQSIIPLQKSNNHKTFKKKNQTLKPDISTIEEINIRFTCHFIVFSPHFNNLLTQIISQTFKI